MTIKLDQIGDAVISGPGTIIRLTDGQPASNIPLDTGYTQIMPESGTLSFNVPVGGRYLATFGLHIAITSITTVIFKLVFDEGAADEQTIGDDASWQIRSTDGEYPSFQHVIDLEAGDHTVKAYAKEVDGSSAYIQGTAEKPNNAPVLTLQLISGSGAGGILTEAGAGTALPQTISSTFSTGSWDDITGATVTFNAVENEQVLISFYGYMYPVSGGIAWGAVAADIDGSTIILNQVSTTAQEYQNVSGTLISPQLTAGSHTIKIKAGKHASYPINWFMVEAELSVTRFRGGLVPIRQDGYDVVDRPQALDFIGAGVYQVTEGTGSEQGVAKIELNQAITAPGATDIATQAPGSVTIDSGTWTEFFSQTITPTVAGEHRIDLSFTTYASGSTNGRFEFKLVFDEGGADEVTVNGAAWYWRQDVFASYKQHSYMEFATLAAKAQTVKAYGRRDSGGFTLHMAGNQSTQVAITALTGSGAAGVLVEEASLSSDSATFSSSTPADVTGLSITLDTSDETVLLLLRGRSKHLTSSGTSEITFVVDGTTVLTNAEGMNGIGLTEDGANWRGNISSAQFVSVAAGSHTFKVQAAVFSTGSFLINEGTTFQVIRFRGGLVPVRSDGQTIVDKPAAFDFIGPGFAVENSGGTARISLLGQDGYLKLSEADGDPMPYSQDGYLYAKDVGGVTALFYMDDTGGLSRLDGYDGGTDEKVAVSANDTTPGYLGTKLVAGSNVTLTELNDGSNETLEIAAAEGGAGTLHQAYLGGRTVWVINSEPVLLDGYGEEALELDGYMILGEIADPTGLGSKGLLYAKHDDAYGTTELFYMDDQGQSTQITQDGYLATYNSLRGVRLLEGENLPSQAGSLSLFAKTVNGVTELFSRDSSGNDLQMTVQGQVASGAAAAPGVLIRAVDVTLASGGVMSSTGLGGTFEATDAELTDVSFTVPVAGRYAFRLGARWWSDSAQSYTRWRAVITGATDYTTDDSREFEGILGAAAGDVLLQEFLFEADLNAGDHTVTIQWKRTSGSGTPNTATNTNFFLVGMLLSGSGAGGTLISFTTKTSDSTNLATGSWHQLSDLQHTFVTVQDEEVILSWGVWVYTQYGGGNHALGYSFDGGTTIYPLSIKSVSPSYWDWNSGSKKIQVGAGSHTLDIYIQPAVANIDVKGGTSFGSSPAVTYNTYSELRQYRGGLVPIQENDTAVLDKPAALNFIGDNVYVTNDNGVADIEILPDGYLRLPEGPDPDFALDQGMVYAKSVDGYSELHYRDSYGAVSQLTRDGYAVGLMGHMEDRPTASPSAYDDDFLGDSLDDKWEWAGAGAPSAASEGHIVANGRLSMVLTNDGGGDDPANDAHIIQQNVPSLSRDWFAWVKIRATPIAGFNRFGLIAHDNGGFSNLYQAVFGYNGGAKFWWDKRVGGSWSFEQNGTVPVYADRTVYVGIEHDSSAQTFLGKWSVDGSLWFNLGTGYDYSGDSWTPSKLGVIFSTNTTSNSLWPCTVEQFKVKLK